MEEIEDLIKMAIYPTSNVPLLMEDAYNRGFVAGKDFAKEKAIKAINEER